MRLPQDDNQCGWTAALPAPHAAHSLRGEHVVDHVVVGAGFAGLAAARGLAERQPQSRIVLVDAQRVGGGASGRNSGFVIDLPHKFALDSPDRAYKQKLVRLNRMAIDQLERLVQQHGIACQWSRAGKYQGAVGPRGLRFLDRYTRLLDDLGEPYAAVEGDALSAVVGTTHYRKAVFTTGSALMNPAALVRGLAASLPANVDLLENSPIQRLERDGRGGFTLVGGQGCLRTRSLLLCTNIFTREFGYLTPNRLLPVMTFASWTRPLSDTEFQAYGGSADWGLTPADHAGTTVRMTLDRRLLVRNTYHHAANYAASERKRAYVRSEHRAAFDIRYPQLADVPFTHTWGGVYAMARNFTNFFGAVEPGVYVAACDNGVGAAWGTVSGALLADLAVGASSPALDDIRSVTGLPALNPPEPLLGWAVRLRILLARWASQGEL